MARKTRTYKGFKPYLHQADVIAELREARGTGKIVTVNSSRQKGKSYLITLRKKAMRAERMKKKPVVLMADRVNMARDNAEALYRYLLDNHFDRAYDIYFCVRGNTTDFKRLSEIGNVLDFGSKEYMETSCSRCKRY